MHHFCLDSSVTVKIGLTFVVVIMKYKSLVSCWFDTLCRHRCLISFTVRPPGMVVPSGLVSYCRVLFVCFRTLCGPVSPSSLGRSPWNFDTWLEMCALRQCWFQNCGASSQNNFFFWGGVGQLFFYIQAPYLRATSTDYHETAKCWETADL